MLGSFTRLNIDAYVHMSGILTQHCAVKAHVLTVITCKFARLISAFKLFKCRTRTLSFRRHAMTQDVITKNVPLLSCCTIVQHVWWVGCEMSKAVLWFGAATRDIIEPFDYREELQ